MNHSWVSAFEYKSIGTGYWECSNCDAKTYTGSFETPGGDRMISTATDSGVQFFTCDERVALKIHDA